MRNSFILFVFCILNFQVAFSQLNDGDVAPDFTVQDLNGNYYSLYAMMGNNKAACLDFMATWCGPCWAFKTSGVMEQVFNNLGNDATVIMLEADWSTNTNCLYGSTGCNSSTQGNWVAGTPYPIADLSASNGPSVKSDYQIAYYPTLYVISPDKRAWNIKSRTYQEYVNWITKSFKLNASATVTPSTCGDNGKIVLAPTGGHSTLTYKWNNGATTKDLSNLPGGTYSVRVTDLNGYYRDFGPFVVQGPAKRVAIVDKKLTNIDCFNNSTGSIAIQLDFGTYPYSYAWSNGKSSNQIDNLPAGTYRVTVSDANSCTATAAYTLTQPPILKLTATSSKEECDGLNGSILAKGSGGVLPYSYDLGFGKQPSNYFSDLPGGTQYTLTIVDNNACSEQLTVFVDKTSKPVASAGDDKAVDCKSEFISLDGSQSEQGPAIAYEWTTKTGKIIKGADTQFPDVSLPGKYNLKVKNVVTQCVNIDSVIVEDLRVYPDISATGDTTLNCKFTETVLKGSSTHLPVHYFWTKVGDTMFLKKEKEVHVDIEGRYVLHVKDTVNLCISTDTVTLNKNQTAPIAMANAERELSCLYPEVIIDGSSSSQGPEFSYNWATADGNIVRGQNTLLPVVNKGGRYILKVFNNINYCDQSTEVNVLQQTDPVADFEQNVNQLTVDFHDISSGLPISWKWTFGDGSSSSQQNPTHIFNAEGEFEVCLEISNDCGTQLKCKKLLVGISATLNLASWEIHNVSCHDGQDGKIELNVQGGVPPYDYTWSTGSKSSSISNLIAGDYHVLIADQQGTKINKTFTIKQPLQLSAKNISVAHTPAGQKLGSILLEIEGGVPTYSYLWNDGQTTNPATDLSAGSYSCKIRDANSCEFEIGPIKIDEIVANSNPDIISFFEVFPNPSNDLSTVKFKLNHAGLSTLRIVDYLGNIVWSESFHTSSMDIKLNSKEFRPGIYLVVLHSENSVKSFKWSILY